MWPFSKKQEEVVVQEAPKPRYGLVIHTQDHHWIMDPLFYKDCTDADGNVTSSEAIVGKVHWILTLAKSDGAQDQFVQIHDLIVRPRDVREVVWCKL